ncbi:hypothetical protein [Rhizobium yanglingense]
MMGLLPWTAKITADRMHFRRARNCIGISGRQRRRIVGKDMAMIFQEPMSQPEPVLHGRLPAWRDACGCTWV